MGLLGPPNIEKLKARGDVGGLVKALGYNERPEIGWRVREDAAEALVEIGPPAVEGLILGLGDIYADDRAAAALGKIGDPRAVAPLVTALQNEYLRRDAGEALARLGAPAIEPLIAALRDPDADVRKVATRALVEIGGPSFDPLFVALREDRCADAAVALGEIGDRRAVEPLIMALGAGNEAMSAAAAMALGKLKDALAVEPLIRALSDRAGDVRANAAKALGEIGDRRAVEPLIAALHDQDRDVRFGAVWALGEIGDARAVEPLIGALETTRVRPLGHDFVAGGGRDREWMVPEAAADALGRIRDPRAVEPLITALAKSDRRVGAMSAWALGRIGDQRAIEPLIDALAVGQCEVYWAATAALGELGPRAVEPLASALRREDRSRIAAGILAGIGGPALAPLLAAAGDPDPSVRGAAINAFAGVDPPPFEPLAAALKNEDEVEEIRLAAARGLARVGDDAAAECLASALRDRNLTVRTAVAWHLVAIGAPAVAPLIVALGSEYGFVREAAAGSLAQMHGLSDLDEAHRRLIRGNQRAIEAQGVTLEDPPDSAPRGLGRGWARLRRRRGSRAN